MLGPQERLAQIRIPEKIGGNPKAPSGPVHFEEDANGELLARKDQNMVNAFGSVTVDGRTVSEKLDAFLRSVVEERAKELNALGKIPVVLDRRIDVAVNAAVDGLRVEMVAMARARLLERLKAAVDAVPLSIDAKIGGAQ